MQEFIRKPLLAQQVIEHLRALIGEQAVPGSRLAPVRELAESLGVSVATVRAAQRLLAAEGLLQIRHGSGVYLAPTTAPRRIAIVSELDILHPHYASFFAREVRELRRFFRTQGYETEFFMGESLPGTHLQKPSCGHFVEESRSGRLAGAVLINAPETGPWRTFIDACPIPLVGAGTSFHAGIDYRDLVRAGLRALAEQGGRRVAVLGWSDGSAGDAFLREEARQVGMQTDPRWNRHDLHPQWHGAGWEMFREIWSAGPQRPDSLLVTDDLLFSEAVIAIAELGIRVPDRLRVASHCNAGSEFKAPFPVTRLRVDAAWCADRLGEMLLRRMKGEALEPGLIHAPIVVERETEQAKIDRNGAFRRRDAPVA